MEFIIIQGRNRSDQESIELITRELSIRKISYQIKNYVDCLSENLSNRFVISIGGPAVNDISARISDIYQEGIDKSKYGTIEFNDFYGSQYGVKANNYKLDGCIALWGPEAPETLRCTENFIREGSILDDILNNYERWTTLYVYKYIVPIPNKIIRKKGFFSLSHSCKIILKSPEISDIAEYLSNWIKTILEFELKVISNEDNSKNNIYLELHKGLGNSNKEYYELTISEDKVELKANTEEGLFRGVQTLIQILIIKTEKPINQNIPIKLQAVEIKDFPRYEWRGVMLDVARHFFGVEDVKRLIDRIALYKFNRFHLHLTDDQGWRIEIDSWSRLTMVGSASQVGGDKGGYYSKEDYKEIINYAKKRYIVVIPEIDMPGHTNAALASYSELDENGIAPAYYSGIEFGFSSLAVRKEITYKFIDDVMKEVSEITPFSYIHIGGDEAKATRDEDYKYFIERVERILNQNGKILIGWAEIAKCNLSQSSIIQYWFHKEYAIDGANKGHKIIMSPAKKLYLDMKYSNNDKYPHLGTKWAGYIDIDTAYNWDPMNELDGVPEEKILGVEAPLWTETITNFQEIEFMLFPRLLAVAEIGWSKSSDKNWNLFRERIISQFEVLKKLGVNYFEKI
ncbi:MAG: family 20 glycosylhydrolase [Candidatus Woesearchaeota archaeon]